jgi:hypothetical protein
MNIDFDSIKTDLFAKGLAHKEMAESATQKMIFVKGEKNRDGSVTVKSVTAGWFVGDFPKTLPVQFDLPNNEDQIRELLSVNFPDVTTRVNFI